ncbi:MAG: hypothetical protein SWX82_09330 [Cyanobacteriota bacterium]|nr:hypothetical protein [Cyanobacteriota bacterium]
MDNSYQNNMGREPRLLRRSGFWSFSQIPYFPSWEGLGVATLADLQTCRLLTRVNALLLSAIRQLCDNYIALRLQLLLLDNSYCSALERHSAALRQLYRSANYYYLSIGQ